MINANDTNILVIGVNVLPRYQYRTYYKHFRYSLIKEKVEDGFQLGIAIRKLVMRNLTVCCSFMCSGDVMLYLPFKVKEEKVHSRHGTFVPMLKMCSQTLASTNQ
jgi:hypothetical protein